MHVTCYVHAIRSASVAQPGTGGFESWFGIYTSSDVLVTRKFTLGRLKPLPSSPLPLPSPLLPLPLEVGPPKSS